MGRDTLIEIINKAEKDAMNGYRYDEASVLYKALENLRYVITHPDFEKGLDKQGKT